MSRVPDTSSAQSPSRSDPSAVDSPIERFVGRRRPRWERLSALLDRATGVSSPRGTLSVEELNELVQLYRQATTDLAIAQRDFPGDRVALFLNQLVGRGYAVIYREPPAAASRLRRFFTRDLPSEYRAAWPYLVAAAALFFGPLVATLLVVIISPDSASLMLPPGMLSEIRSGHTWFASEGAERPALATFIMTNNVQVSLMALGGGMLAGVGTVAVLVLNGIDIGAIAGALIAYGLWRDLLGFVSPHGFLELSVVVVAGGCGLMLARAIVWPGLATRGEALVAAGGRSVRLLLGMLPFLGVAGLLEGFVSPLDFAWPAKLAIGLATAAGLYAYLLLVGRSARR
jgi:uncharacterized membrane protein SpoIIM required for sporulation